MDEDLKTYLETMRREINDGQERLLNRLGALQQNFVDTKGFLVRDAIVSGRRWLDRDGRVTLQPPRDGLSF